MRIGIAADHGGFALKDNLLGYLRETGHEVKDFGAYVLNPDDDFPDFVIPMARAVAAGEVERGIAVCGSGVGAGVAANKISGVRAALIQDSFSARQGVEDDDMNVICLGGRVIGFELARELVEIFLKARFAGRKRFQRRLRKIEALENRRKKWACSHDHHLRPRSRPASPRLGKPGLWVFPGPGGAHLAGWLHHPRRPAGKNPHR